MDSCPLKYYMAGFWLSDAYLSKARTESFLDHMIYAGIKTSVKKGMEERARHWHFRDAGTDTIGGFS